MGTIKVFPVGFRFPPFLGFGNDHNPKALIDELTIDEPDLIHFHNYYMYSFPYLAELIKRKIGCPFTVQLHTYHKSWWRRMPHLPALLQLRLADKIFYSYSPEEKVYDRLGLREKAVRVPVPSIDPRMFNPDAKRDEGNLLYVGRFPSRLSGYAEKSPALILFLFERLSRTRDVKLIIAGDGVGLPYHRHLASELGIEDKVEFEGFMPRSELPGLYLRSSLTILPLRLHDIDGFFDGCIQESLACGTAVAAFRFNDSAPMRGTYGYMLSPDPGRASRELSLILDDGESLRDFGLKGSAFVHSHCTEEDLSRTLRSVWEGLLKR